MSFKIADGHVEVHAKHNRAATRRSAQEAVDEAERVGRSHEGSMMKWLFKTNPSLMRMLEAPIGSIFGSPIMFAAAATAAGILGGAISAALATAILGGVGAGLIAAAAFALRKNKELKKEWEQATKSISKMFTRAAAPMLEPLKQGIDYFEKRMLRLEPSFKRLFTLTGPLVKPAVDMLMGLIEGMLPGIEKAMPGIQTVFDTLAKHMPGLGTAIGDFFVTIAENGPLLERVVGLLITWLEIFFKVLGPIIVEGMRSFATAADMWKAFTEAVVNGVNWIGDTWKKIPGWWDASWGAVSGFFSDLWGKISGFFTGLGSGTADVWGSVTETIKSKWQTVVDWFQALPGKIGTAVSAIPGLVGSFFQMMFDQALYLIGFGAGLVVKAFTDLPVAVWNVTQAGFALVIGLFAAAGLAMLENTKNAFNWIVAAVGTGFTWIGNKFREGWAWAILNTTNSIRSIIRFVGELPGVLYRFAVDTFVRMLGAFKTGGFNLVNYVIGLPGRIMKAVSSLKGSMGNAGKDAIRGLINGLESMMGWAVDQAKRAARKIAQGFKDALKIGSPSKVMADEVGHWIPAGVAEGMNDNMGVVDDAMSTFPDMLPRQPVANHAEQVATSQNTNYGGVTMNVSVQNIAELRDILAFLDGQMSDRTKQNTWAGNIYEAQGQYERSYR